jgi:hypothetical protein
VDGIRTHRIEIIVGQVDNVLLALAERVHQIRMRGIWRPFGIFHLYIPSIAEEIKGVHNHRISGVHVWAVPSHGRGPIQGISMKNQYFY